MIENANKIHDEGFYACTAFNSQEDSHTGTIQIEVLSKFYVQCYKGGKAVKGGTFLKYFVIDFWKISYSLFKSYPPSPPHHKLADARPDHIKTNHPTTITYVNWITFFCQNIFDFLWIDIMILEKWNYFLQNIFF